MNDITVSIVSHGQRELASLLLSDLDRIRCDLVRRIIVTLNIDEPWSPPTSIGGAPVLTIRNARQAGFAANHNEAFRHCETSLFVIANPDVRLHEDPFAALAQALAHPRCALAVPWQVDARGQVEDFRRRIPTPLSLVRRAASRDRRLTETADMEWVAGSFMAVRSEVFRELAGFDAGYRLYCEDVDLCLRLQLADWRIEVLPHTVVVHDARRSSGGGSWRHLRWHLMSFVRLWTSRAFWRYRKSR
jgi:GT2 family glycosyltransferase